jgi:putative FmdB family regulatory protein
MYEFVCRECGAEFEELLTHAELEAGEVSCPECGSDKVERQLSSFASGGGSAGGGCVGTGGFT